MSGESKIVTLFELNNNVSAKLFCYNYYRDFILSIWEWYFISLSQFLLTNNNNLDLIFKKISRTKNTT